MNNKFNDFIENLQKEIIKKEIEDHNEKIVNLFYNPYNWGKPPQKEITVYDELRGGKKGYFLGIYLKIENGVIIKAKFITDGCGVMIATGSQTMMLIEGKNIQFAEKLVAGDISMALMGLPDGEKHCADFMVETLRNTIRKYKVK
ncbi:hypothetical protein LCGC14_1941900 [marine sediment metagenome]|uniref:NIF system FeS cluster assembly NifU N-terminal domain-containing protein n=1 Tax=marine sediment metagenome TaxID=412755 RepID=A0A0F9IH78_9ZZZZ